LHNGQQNTEELIAATISKMIGIEPKLDRTKDIETLVKDPLKMKEDLQNLFGQEGTLKDILSEKHIELTSEEYVQSANYYFYAGNYEKALKIYDIILSKYPNNITALVNKGIISYRLGKYKEAIILFNKSLFHDHANVDSLVNKGIVYYRLGKLKEALDCFNKGLSIDEENIDALSYKAFTLQRLGKGNGEETELYEIIARLEVDTKNTESIVNKGIALLRLGRLDESKKLFEKALDVEVDAKNIDGLVNKGFALYCLQRYKEAIVLYEEALKVDENNIYALYNAACTYSILGNGKKSLDSLEKVVKSQPEYKHISINDSDFNNLKNSSETQKLFYDLVT
jgi:tetratricopeptide (TPR) repeat protein